DQRLTYSELDCRSDELACDLGNMGVGPEVIVGLCTHRSLDMLVGLLGILKAGGAYLPLDPNYPRARLAYMISDANVPVLVVQQGVEDRLPANDIPQVVLDGQSRQIGGHPRNPPRNQSCPGNLLYVIYTSGTTGNP